LSVALFEKVSISEALSDANYLGGHDLGYEQISLFK